MSYVVAPDISHYQPTLSDAYPRDFVIFKATQGTYYTDTHLTANAVAANRLHTAGSLAGAVAYHVFTAEDTDAQYNKIIAALGVHPPNWLAGVMLDLESWAGTSYALHGDYSPAINRLYARLAAWIGSPSGVVMYGNAYDLAMLASHRDGRAPVILAAYTSELRYSQIRGAIGQQYSDGETKWAVPTIDGHQLPRSTPTLGNCDHNVFPGFADGKALRQRLRPTVHQPTPTDLLEQIMALDRTSDEYKALMADVQEAARAGAHTVVDNFSQGHNLRTNLLAYLGHGPILDGLLDPRHQAAHAAKTANAGAHPTADAEPAKG